MVNQKTKAIRPKRTEDVSEYTTDDNKMNGLDLSMIYVVRIIRKGKLWPINMDIIAP